MSFNGITSAGGEDNLEAIVSHLRVTIFNFSLKNELSGRLAPDGVLPYASPRAAGTLPGAIPAPDGGVITNSPGTGDDIGAREDHRVLFSD